MCTLVKEISNWYDCFLRLSGFPDLFGKVFLITFKFSLFESSATFLQEQEQCKKDSLISLFILQRGFNDSHTSLFLKLKLIYARDMLDAGF